MTTLLNLTIDRTRREELEAQTLAPFAVRSRDSLGRFYPDSEPAYRTAFQRDRDRIVHSAAFRRLEYKTQVFVNDEGDYYRTRLTHSLEVAQIGRTLARALGVNEDLVETICLAHDLGHPPFGHAGEAVLNRLVNHDGGYNHNVQTFRIVTELEQRYPDHPGLNLTRETLAGIAAHGSAYRPELLRRADFDGTLRGSLEAQIAEAADELAYNAHDLDDGIRAGIIELEALNELELWRAMCERLGWRRWSANIRDEIARHVFIREVVGVAVDDVLACTADNLAALNPRSSLEIQRHSADVVAYGATLRRQYAALKDFLYERMYYHFRIVRMQQRAERFITEIYTALESDPRQLPPDCQVQLKERSLARVIADYIASMTDRSALLEYRRLYDPLMRP